MINLEALAIASKELKNSAFKLFIYLAKNQNSYKFALSNKDFKDYSGINRTGYDNAVKELIEKGYLEDKGNNNFVFYELPKKAE